MSSDLLLKLVEKLGVPGLFFGLAVYAASWFADSVARPVTERHLRFVDSVESIQREQALALKRLADLLERRPAASSTSRS